MNKIKKLFTSTQFKNGSFSAGIIVLVIAIVVVLNMIVSSLPTTLTNMDMSDKLLYSVGETTEELLGSLDKDVEIKVIAETGSVDTRIEQFLSRYSDLSSHISVEYLDPVLHPSVLTEYGVDSYSLVVTCPDTDKSTTIDFNDIIVYDYSQYYYGGNITEKEFDGEGQLASAIDYVTSDNTKKIYMMTGHEEQSFSTDLEDLIQKANMTTEEYNMLTDGAIPEDCDLLISYAPTRDLADDEMTALLDYINNGGKAMIIRTATDETLDNFDEVMKTYGMNMTEGYIAEPTRYYTQGRSAYNFFPTIMNSDINGDLTTDSLILVSAVKGMTLDEEEPEGVTLTPFLSTTSEAYEINGEEQNQGLYYLGVSVEVENQGTAASDTDGAEAQETAGLGETAAAEETENAGETAAAEETESTAETAELEPGRLTVLTVDSMIDTNITSSFTNIENLTEFMNVLTSNFEDVDNISIPAKSLEESRNTFASTGIWSSLFIGIIPAVLLVIGFVVWIRRRRA